MKLPKITKNNFKERIGVSKVQQVLLESGILFRETNNTDVGIDGQIELTNDNEETTGQLIGVQIKYGKSYIRFVKEERTPVFYPNEKHVNYWKNMPIPVILFVYNPDTDVLFYQEVRQYLRNPLNYKKTYITLQYSISSNKSILKQQLADLSGSKVIENISLIELLPKKMLDQKCNKVSFFDLFIFGQIYYGKLFFNIELYSELNYILYSMNNNTDDYIDGIGLFEHDFFHNYIEFLIKENLAYIDYSEYLLDYRELNLSPNILAKLTQRGNQLVSFIREEEYKVYEKKLTFFENYSLILKLDDFLVMQMVMKETKQLKQHFLKGGDL